MSTIQSQKSGHGIPLYLSFHQVVYFVLFFRHTSRLSHPLISIDTVLDFLNTKSMQQNFYFGYLECKTFRYHFQYANKKFRYVLGDFEKYFLQNNTFFGGLPIEANVRSNSLCFIVHEVESPFNISISDQVPLHTG